jgi:FXSXX-COOH protein
VNNENSADKASEALLTSMADVSNIPLGEFRSAGDSVLASSLRRLLREAADPEEPIAGFTSQI